MVSYGILGGKRLTGPDMSVLPERQVEGIRKVSERGATVKVNTVLIPGVNDDHIEDIARTVSHAGAAVFNVIPLLPQHELAHVEAPGCGELNRARAVAEKYLDVFYHCRHCLADACGIPGVSDFSRELYGSQMETFSHG